MAELILKSKIKLAGIQNVRVSSAGIYANEGDKISRNSALALKQMGIKSYSFKSKRLNVKMLLNSDIAICMTKEHKIGISNFPEVYAVSELCDMPDISDPYGCDISVYLKTCYEIEDFCNILLNKIIEKLGE